MLRKIHEGVSNSAQAEGQSAAEAPYLKQQFDEAHDYLISKISEHNTSSNDLFGNSLSYLEKVGGGPSTMSAGSAGAQNKSAEPQ